MAGSSTITRGNLINTIVVQTTLTPVAVAANSTIEQQFTVQGILVGDQISNFNYLGVYPNTDVSFVNLRTVANNVIGVTYQNGSGGSLTPPSGLYYIEVNRLENLQTIPAGIV